MHPRIRIARTTGLLYLILALTGMLGFLLIRPQLLVPDDPAQTLAHLLEREGLARLGIALEMAIVVSQALLALWFFRLFRAVDGFAATSLAAFGLMNAAVILASSAFLVTALQTALGAGTGLSGDAAGTTQLMYLISGSLWEVGKLFFGLWLVPMGWLVLRSGWMPQLLGWLLVAGGAAYVLGAFLGILLPGAGAVAEALSYVATVGEFWMLGYLLLVGVRPAALDGPGS